MLYLLYLSFDKTVEMHEASCVLSDPSGMIKIKMLSNVWPTYIIGSWPLNIMVFIISMRKFELWKHLSWATFDETCTKIRFDYLGLFRSQKSGVPKPITISNGITSKNLSTHMIRSIQFSDIFSPVRMLIIWALKLAIQYSCSSAMFDNLEWNYRKSNSM